MVQSRGIFLKYKKYRLDSNYGGLNFDNFEKIQSSGIIKKPKISRGFEYISISRHLFTTLLKGADMEIPKLTYFFQNVSI